MVEDGPGRLTSGKELFVRLPERSSQVTRGFFMLDKVLKDVLDSLTMDQVYSSTASLVETRMRKVRMVRCAAHPVAYGKRVHIRLCGSYSDQRGEVHAGMVPVTCSLRRCQWLT